MTMRRPRQAITAPKTVEKPGRGTGVMKGKARNISRAL
jgi:hypothetical protein